ncbi:phosphatidylinositol-specific phospholipase [Fusarium denticulatum]|uniref:Phosphatidylinositol-specific phospholipase n=1 Tax=Fusarium denticulatum TaxID=48507 RepID=A0A8H5U2H9_9HYPO|nr:phosphatidylinositol-specific phospholipase [Fusarium denticulatum]
MSLPSWTDLGTVPTLVKTKFPTALAVHAGSLWLVYLDESRNIFSLTMTNGQWPSSQPVNVVNGTNIQDTPSMAVVNGELHMVYADTLGTLNHCRYNDNAKVWAHHTGVGSVVIAGAPSVACFNSDELWCAYRRKTDSQLMITKWNAAGGWDSPNQATGAPGNVKDDVSLTVVYGQLRMMGVYNDTMRFSFELQYRPASNDWEYLVGPKQRVLGGVSMASTVPDFAIAAYQTNEFPATLNICQYSNNKWSDPQSLQKSPYSTPAVVILNGKVYAFWNDAQTYNLQWAIRDEFKDFQLESWMSNLPNGKSLSEFTIPGTHDSGALSYIQNVACQRMDIMSQLNAGDGPGSGGEQQFGDAVDKLINANKNMWLLGNSVPNTTEIRGKIQLIRRYWTRNISPGSWGIDLKAWRNNNPNFSMRSGTSTIQIQDKYAITINPPSYSIVQVINDKFAIVKDHLDRAKADPDLSKLYLNFASATSTINGGWANIDNFLSNDPHTIALGTTFYLGRNVTQDAGVNKKVEDYATAKLGAKDESVAW